MTYIRETFVSLSAHGIAHIVAETCAATPAVTLEVTRSDGRRVVSLTLHTEEYGLAKEIADAINAVFAARKSASEIAA